MTTNERRVLALVAQDLKVPVTEEALREMLKAGNGPPISNRELWRVLEQLRVAKRIRFMNAPGKKGWILNTPQASL